jgi:hypothetical protein
VLDNFPKYYMEILLGDVNTKLVRGDVVKPTIEEEGGEEKFMQGFGGET